MKWLTLILLTVALAAGAPPPFLHNPFSTNDNVNPINGVVPITNNAPITVNSDLGPNGEGFFTQGRFSTTNPGQGLLNVRDYGAKGDGITDDTAAFNLALTNAILAHTGIFIPAGPTPYIIDTIDVSSVSIIQGGSGQYGYACLIQKAGSTNDMIQTALSPVFRPVIKDVQIQGNYEKNLRSPRTISNIISRYTFDVSSPPIAGYTNAVFFFYKDTGGTNHYLGSGMVSNVVGNTITLNSTWDYFATPTSSGGKLTTDCVACFGGYTDHGGSCVAFDPSLAGNAGIDVEGLGAYLQLQNVRIEGFFTGLRHGQAISTMANGLFISKCALASFYCAVPCGSDNIFLNSAFNGIYVPVDNSLDITNSVALDNPLYRCSRFGAVVQGSNFHFNTLLSFWQITPLFLSHATSVKFVDLDLDNSICTTIRMDGNSTPIFGHVELHDLGQQSNHTFPVIENVDGVASFGDVISFPYSGSYAGVFVTNLTSTAHIATANFVKSPSYAYDFDTTLPIAVDDYFMDGIHYVSSDGTSGQGFTVLSANGTNYFRGNIQFRKAGGTTQLPLLSSNGQWLGTIEWLGKNTAGYGHGAYILAVQTGDLSGTNYLPTEIEFYTSDGTNDAAYRGGIRSDGVWNSQKGFATSGTIGDTSTNIIQGNGGTNWTLVFVGGILRTNGITHSP